MTRRISLHPDEPLLLVQSEYNDRIRLAIKGFRGARWDSERRVWQLPLEHRDGLIERLAPFSFDVDEEVRAAEADAAEPESASETDETLTIRQINNRIGGTILRGFPAAVWVRGEVAGFDKGARRRHWYFELIENSAGSDDVAARLPVVVFKTRRERIERRLARAVEPLALRDGLEIRARGRVEYYSAGGKLQLIIDDVDPDFAFGQLARRRSEILRAIEREGLSGLNAALPWPALPLRIGLITAPDSDALHDVVETLARSHYGFRVVHLPVAVQGAQLEPEVLKALATFEQYPDAVDLVLLVRGGGARSDLAWFDNLTIARAVARHPVKVVLGIGHERDQTVLDAVAHAEKTPTAAAELAVGMVAWAEEHLDRLTRQLAERTRRRMTQEQARHQQDRARLATLSRASLRRSRQTLERQLLSGVRLAARSRVSVERARLDGLATRLDPRRVGRALAERSTRHAAQRQRLERAAQARLAASAQHLDVAAARLSAADPRRVLARGFAILHNEQGHIVRAPDDAPLGSAVTATLQRGRLVAQVRQHDPDPEDP